MVSLLARGYWKHTPYNVYHTPSIVKWLLGSSSFGVVHGFSAALPSVEGRLEGLLTQILLPPLDDGG
jgi:hypothetical protein